MTPTWCAEHNWTLSGYPGRQHRCALSQGDCRPVVKEGVLWRWDYQLQAWVDAASGEAR